MNKQEEIREETERHIRACLKLARIENDVSDSLSESLMVLLDGLGVVIKVERELPDCGEYRIINLDGGTGSPTWIYDKELMAKTCPMAGYVAVEPLV